MPFWLAFGIVEEHESGGRGISVRVLQRSFTSLGEATRGLADAEASLVGSHVTKANAYVVEADTIHQASTLVREDFANRESTPRVRLVQQHIPTRRIPEAPEIEALNRLHGELCITHQLTKLTLTRVTTDQQRARLERHKEILEDLGYAVRVMLGETPNPAATGSDRLGYSNGHVAGAETATFPGALASLACELSIARHQATLAGAKVPVHQKQLDDLRAELDRFEATVTELQRETGSTL